MKDIHRSEKLDAYEGKRVFVELYDGEKINGVFHFADTLCPPHYCKPGFYYVENTKRVVVFRKSYVKKIFIPRGMTR